ncbi:MAG: hypothetical protein ACE37F_24030 [Nannocystaceae bacterium]|nr:hypothetical protein [bacterium]
MQASSSSTGEALPTTTSTTTTDTPTGESSSSEGGDTSSTAGSSSSSESGGSESTGSPDPALCDPIAQDCVDPEAAKCGLRWNDGDPIAACEPILGEGALGEACALPGGILGEDDCAPGLFCSNFGVAEGRVCRSICSEGTCDAGEACVDFFNWDYGVCSPTCAIAGDDCPEGTGCQPIASRDEPGSATICTPTGPAQLGEECNGLSRCEEGLMCVAQLAGPVTCEQFCEIEGELTCPDGVQCLPLLDTPGWGFCNPS